MSKIFQFIPLFFWAAVGFGALYTLLETTAKPISVLLSSIGAVFRILTRHWKVAAALLVVFVGAPVVEVAVVFGLKLSGQALVLSGFLWQAVTAASIAWIATYIHDLTITLPQRDQRSMHRYRIVSMVTGLGIFLTIVGFSIVSSFTIQKIGLEGRYGAEFWASLLQTLVFVPLSLIRPAISLGEKNPVRVAFLTAARSPIVLGVWVTVLALPVILFDMVGGDILRAHHSLRAAVVVALAKAVFNVAACAFFEATTLLLFARATNRLNFDMHASMKDIILGTGAEARHA
ncbi:hypothetical protein M2323_004581 [Rhodoblastus acidophilus]|uniref:hypothetical protein n=1 Tax=Rhodoblastus acidophilus TaxID=1074 RepID=UPI002224D06D|nr:hypothetical protein [Rhodoblastus acidophilus]MCW2283833.1 hypothetical protein [Rhodoblastus acidophilus]MCW2335629.1 hypothetical protein [Rhodoblastus acidophilus]